MPLRSPKRFVIAFSADLIEGYLHLKTLPTGTRWSVVVGHGVMSITVYTLTDTITFTSIGNLVIATREG
uniref:Hypothetical TATE DNA Transposon n=1 Tax=Leishmania guyanensis TaxID=5670 RepID=A0A1E1J5W0_LEIGU|nr:Hypothetical TATE DNA Transposon [Leishmania guyanensis]